MKKNVVCFCFFWLRWLPSDKRIQNRRKSAECSRKYGGATVSVGWEYGEGYQGDTLKDGRVFISGESWKRGAVTDVGFC